MSHSSIQPFHLLQLFPERYFLRSELAGISGGPDIYIYIREPPETPAAAFVFHELPQEATRNIIAELYRISNSGGVVAITDNNPMSAVIQNLPPALFTLMKATEPWSDQYYVFDLEAALRDAGFVDVKTVETDPRHRTVLARKPATDPDSL